MIDRRVRQAALAAVTGLLLAVWIVPVGWGFLTSLKTERDVLAYPPKVLFAPTFHAGRLNPEVLRTSLFD